MSPAPKRKTPTRSTPKKAAPLPPVARRSFSFDRMWRLVRWPLLIVALLYIALVIYRIPAVGDQQKTTQAVAQIQSQHITLADVMGDNLPFVPYEPNNDATVAGIDQNNNGIRDDVELAIFKLHPDSAKIRAAELQYALDQQIMITEVLNNQTWIAAAQEDSRGFACIGDSVPITSDSSKDLKTVNARAKEVRDLVLNTPARQNAWHTAYNFTTSYGDLNASDCDIDINLLPN
ncbi:MAG: hypothetical protein KGH79_00990 [Patescibacteria group bacterium]|nr:hypothetical protein [Patescibacteria group bacterium]